jgi:hypothetical protein
VDWLILILFALLPFAAFRFVRTRRTGWGWAMPLVALGLGLLSVIHIDRTAVSEQSRGFGSIAVLLLFTVIAVLAVVGCIVGHVARWIEAGMRGERDR